MTSIKLIVNGAKAKAEVHGVLTSGTVGIPVEIEYDSAWRGLKKTLLCTSGKLEPAKNAWAILNADGYSMVAHEALIADNRLYVGVEGRNADGTLVIATTWADCGIIFPGASVNAAPSAKTAQPVWAQLQAQIEQLKQQSGGSFQNVELDTTLTQRGKAADAKAVGDALNNITEGVVVGRFFGKTANFLGDSQTDDAGNYKSVFFYDWLKNILGLSATNNYGYSGTTIMPISGQNKSFVDRYPGMRDDADLIVVWGGTNDYHYGHPLGNVDDTANTTFCGALNNLCKGLIAKYPQKDILFVTPTPRGNIAGAVATQQEYADAIINVCAKYCIPVFDAFRKCNMPINYEYPRKHTVDGLHLNDLGHEILGKSMANFILYGEMAGAQKAWGESSSVPDIPDAPDSPDTTVNVTDVALNKTAHSLAVGETVQLTATVIPSNATNKAVFWSASNGNCAVSNGLVTAVSSGDCVIMATTEDGGFTASCVITVSEPVADAPASPVDGKTVTFTAQASWPAATNLTLLVNAADFPSYVYTDTLTVRATIADATKTISGFGAGMQIFTDETGQLNNGAFKTGISEYVSSTIEGNEIIATAIMEDTQPDYAYAKIAVPLSISEYPVSFKIVSLTAELNGTYIPIQAVGGFYGNEGCSIS